jgi:type IV pilus assembly protein PilA
MNRLRKGFTLVELMIVVAIIGILAAIAIPNFIRFQARSKQAEAKTNLKAIFTGQKSYYAEKDRFSTLTGDIGFAPERGNRYGYKLDSTASAAGNCEDRSAAVAVAGTAGSANIGPDKYRYPSAQQFEETTPSAPGVVTYTALSAGIVVPTSNLGGVYGVCPATCSFSGSAKGNIDNDAAIDYHVVASEYIGVATNKCNEAQPQVQPGASAHLYNDVSCDLN